MGAMHRRHGFDVISNLFLLGIWIRPSFAWAVHSCSRLRRAAVVLRREWHRNRPVDESDEPS